MVCTYTSYGRELVCPSIDGLTGCITRSMQTFLTWERGNVLDTYYIDDANVYDTRLAMMIMMGFLFSVS